MKKTGGSIWLCKTIVGFGSSWRRNMVVNRQQMVFVVR
jgi:hypothetical protein